MYESDDKLASLKNRATLISSYQSFVLKAKKELTFMPSYDEPKRVRLLNAIDKKLNNIEVPHGYKRLHQRLLNEIKSFKQAISDVPVEQLIPVTFESVYAECGANLDVLTKRIDKIEAGTGDICEADEETKRILVETGSQLPKIKRSLTRKWVAIRASVVPVPDNAYINISAMKGFHVENMNGYPVMHKQLCIGLNKDLLKQAGIRDIKGYLKKLITHLSTEKQVQYILVTDKPMFQQDITGFSVSWYWLMDKREANNFRLSFNNFNASDIKKTLGVSGIAVRGWGFANASE